ETQLFNVRAIIVLIISVIMMVILMARLFNLQVMDHDIYTTLSENNRFHIAAVPPTRGLIYDANGVILAQNLPTYALELVPEQIEDIDKTIAELAQLIPITEADIRRFNKLRKGSRQYKSIPLRTRLSDEEVARIAVNRHRFSGADIAARLVRHYPHGTLAAHVVGYVGRINEKEWAGLDQSDYDGTDYIGKTGVEKFYEDRLHGHVGVEQIETNASGRTLRTIAQVPSESGQHLLLSLDASLQTVAELALEKVGLNGAVVAINPKTGALLVMASVPSFDPNLFVTGIDRKTYRALQNNENKPLFNRAMQGRYPPGSTVKPFIALGGLELGAITADHEVNCRGFFRIPGSRHKYRDWKKTGHGKVSTIKAIRESCDVYFYTLARKIGVDRLANFMFSFGFNQRTGVDVSGEGVGTWPTSAWKRKKFNLPWYPGETVIAGIGQGYTLVTPLQLAQATAALSRYGRRIQPHVVDEIEDSTTGVRERLLRVEDDIPIVDRKNWDTVLEGMIQVVNSWRGTARRIAKGATYKIAGKTGTAQVFSVKQDEEYDEKTVPKKLRDHALFIAFAPVDDPQIAVAVIVENGGHGGSVAAPIARQVMDNYLIPRLADEVPAKKDTKGAAS
ncbi:MAG: penicillin-binding protein 2, partial [Thiohalomonadales bacterium]